MSKDEWTNGRRTAFPSATLGGRLRTKTGKVRAFRSLVLRPLVLSPLVLFSSCHALRPAHEAWNEPEQPEVIQRVAAAKAAEGRYARVLEADLHGMLATLLPADAVRVHVYLQLDFDQSWQSEQMVPDEQRLLEQRSTIQEKSDAAERLSSEDTRFQPAGAQSTVIYHPGRIQQLGMVVLVDQAQIGDWDARELSERLFKLIAAGSPYREERGDRLEILITPFRP